MCGDGRTLRRSWKRLNASCSDSCSNRTSASSSGLFASAGATAFSFSVSTAVMTARCTHPPAYRIALTLPAPTRRGQSNEPRCIMRDDACRGDIDVAISGARATYRTPGASVWYLVVRRSAAGTRRGCQQDAPFATRNALTPRLCRADGAAGAQSRMGRRAGSAAEPAVHAGRARGTSSPAARCSLAPHTRTVLAAMRHRPRTRCSMRFGVRGAGPISTCTGFDQGRGACHRRR